MEPGEVAWGYAGARGPAAWASLSGAYAMCGGRRQSPVALAGYTRGERAPLGFSYGTPAAAIRNDGVFLHPGFPAGNSLVSYGLRSAHLHAPSEHAVDGVTYAAELHLVHADGYGRPAVVGLLFVVGEPDPVVQTLLDAAPPTGETTGAGAAIDPGALVPAETPYFRYEGSKTTPPCDEGVAWHVMREVRTVSAGQVDALLGAQQRPDQPPAPAAQRPAHHARGSDLETHRGGIV